MKLILKPEEQNGYIGTLRKSLKAQTVYLQSLETSDMFATQTDPENEDTDKGKKKKSQSKKSKAHPAHNAQALALQECAAGLIALHGKLHGDL
jgi:hypothetical protein